MMFGVSKLKVIFRRKLHKLDAHTLLISYKLLMFGGLFKPENDTRGTARRLLQTYISIFNLLFVIISIVPMIREKDFRLFAERIIITLSFYYGVILYFTLPFFSQDANHLVREVQNSGYRIKTQPLRKIKIVFVLYTVVISLGLLSIVEAVFVNNTGCFTEIWLPYDMHRSRFIYYATSIILSISVLPTTHGIGAATGLFASLMVFFADCFESLHEKIMQISVLEEDMSETERDEIIRSRFYECIAMHHWILSLYQRIRGLLELVATLRSIALNISFAFSGVVILMELSDHNPAGLSTPLSFMMSVGSISLLLFSIGDEVYNQSVRRRLQSIRVVLCQQCLSQSVGVSHAWFEADWLRWPRDIRRVLPLAIARAQRPVACRVIGMYYFNREYFLQILYNCYTLFAFIREKMH